MTDSLATLACGAESILDRALTDREANQFAKYLEILTKWQKIVRLIGQTNAAWIVENLFLDSLFFLRVLPSPIGRVLDLGAGAGFPGIPIKIVRADTALVLVEARERRASFLAAAVRELGLTDVEVVNARAEDVVDRLAGKFDAVVMRCAGNAEALIRLALRFVQRNGCVVVAGPPTPRVQVASRTGWVEVPGIAEVRSGAPRRFRVARPVC